MRGAQMPARGTGAVTSSVMCCVLSLTLIRGPAHCQLRRLYESTQIKLRRQMIMSEIDPGSFSPVLFIQTSEMT